MDNFWCLLIEKTLSKRKIGSHFVSKNVPNISIIIDNRKLLKVVKRERERLCVEIILVTFIYCAIGMEPALSDRKLTILSALPVKNDGKMSKIRKEKAEKTFPRKEEDEEGFCLSNIIFSCPKCISTSLLSYKYFERKNTN